MHQKENLKPQMPRNLASTNSSTQQTSCAKPKVIDIAKDKLNVRYKGIQKTIDKITEKRIEQVARKTIRIATKVKDPKACEQKIQNHTRKSSH